MGKTIQEQIGGFTEGLKVQAGRAKAGDVTWIDAAKGFLVEIRKAAFRLVKGGTSNDRKRAIAMVKRGMKAYNDKNYEYAEELFRRAVSEDPDYARGHAYLGNTYYKQKRIADAVSAWNKAVLVEPGSDAAEMAQEKLGRIARKNREGVREMEIDLLRGRE